MESLHYSMDIAATLMRLLQNSPALLRKKEQKGSWRALNSQSVEELSSQVRMLRGQLTDLHKRLSCWSNPDQIDNVEHLKQMEDSLRASLDRVRLHKEKFGERKLMPLDCTSQFENGLHLPMMMGGAQEDQTLSWFPDNEIQHVKLLEKPSFLPQRDVECSGEASIPSCSGLFDTDKQIEMGNTGHVDGTRQGGAMSELCSTSQLRPQLNELCPYHPFGSLNFPEGEQLKPEMETNLQGILDYQINCSFDMPIPIFNNMQQAWTPASGPSIVRTPNGTSCSQVRVPLMVLGAFS